MSLLQILGATRGRSAACLGAATLAASLLSLQSPATAASRPWLIPPVDAAIARGFDLPRGQYGPGNRGLDYAVVAGTPVRAAGAGTVSFAGSVGGTIAVTLNHGDGLETTYTGMRELYVARGDTIDRGHWIGETVDRFHFGVKLHDVYVDPRGWLGPVETGDAIHLIPVKETENAGRLVEMAIGRELEGLDTIGCTQRELLRSPQHHQAPNDNIAVSIGGIGDAWSRAASAGFAGLASGLGYSGRRSYVLSYSDDPDAYERSDTFGDLRAAARRLDLLLQRVAATHPGRDVDILAHSQGGLVARYYLATSGARLDPRRPRVEHVVTFSSPHQGAPLASAAKDVAGSWSGKLALDGLSRAHDGGDPWPVPDSFKFGQPALQAVDALLSGATSAAARFVPDPYARAVQQMRPGATFIANLGTDDVAYGTQVLALQDRFDLVVPAGHARWPGEANRAVDGHANKMLGGLNRHRGILDNPEALAMTHSFLRGARLPCLDEGDQVAWDWGRRIATGTNLLPHVWQAGEDAVLSVALKGKATTVKAVVREGSTVARLLRARGLRGVVDYGRDKVTYVIRHPREVLEWLVEQRLDKEIQDAVEEMLRIIVEVEE
jgi:hypothetical protein